MPPDIFFAGPGLDRSDQLRADPDALARLASSPDARELVWDGALPALDEAGRLVWGPVRDPALFLGREGTHGRFSPLAPEAGDLRAQFGALAHLSPLDAPSFAAAVSLSAWHRRHGFCAACGQVSELARGGWSRNCSTCTADHFPRVDPVVIMLATHDDRVLLGRQPRFPPKRFSALAGFVEVGEALEDAVARELFEEAGVRAHSVDYVASQPWPFPSSLMIACTAECDDDRLVIDHTELEHARWFTRAEVAAAMAGDPEGSFIAPPRFAIARDLLDRWLAA